MYVYKDVWTKEQDFIARFMWLHNIQWQEKRIIFTGLCPNDVHKEYCPIIYWTEVV